MDRTTVRNDVEWILVTIAASATSPASAVSLGGMRLFAVALPAALTSTAMTFTATCDGTALTVYDDANSENYTITVAASTVVPVNIPLFAGFDTITPVLGTAEAAQRVIKLGVRPV